MRQVTYAGETFLVSDDVAEALLDLGAALANSGRALHVKVPASDEHLEPIVIGLVLGPASQFACRPTDADARTEDGDFVATTRRAVKRLQETTPFPTDLDVAGDAAFVA